MSFRIPLHGPVRRLFLAGMLLPVFVAPVRADVLPVAVLPAPAFRSPDSWQGPVNVTFLKFAPDGQTLAAGYWPTRGITLWEVSTLKPRAGFLHQTGWINRPNSVAFSPDGKSLAVATWDGPVKLQDPVLGRLQAILDQESQRKGGGFAALDVTRDGAYVVKVGVGAIRLWDLASGELRKEHTFTPEGIRAAALSPDGKTIALSLRGSIALHDLATGAEQAVLKGGHTLGISLLAFTPDGKTLLAATEDRPIKLWDVKTGKEVGSLATEPGPADSLVVSPDGTLAAAGTGGGTFMLWDLATCQKRAVLRSPSPERGPFTGSGVAFSPDGKLLACAGHGATINLWSVAQLLALKGEILSAPKPTPTRRVLVEAKLTLRAYERGAAAVAFTPDGKTLVAGGRDRERTVRRWDTATGKEQDPLPGTPRHDTLSVAVHPDGKLLAAGGLDHVVRLWDLATGERVTAFEGHELGIHALAFSADGKRLISAGADRTARLWDVAAGKELHVLRGHFGEIHAVVISPDGKLIATGSADETVKLWDAATGQGKATLRGHRGEVRALVFAPDGQRLYSASTDETARVWEVATGRELMRLESGTSQLIQQPGTGQVVSLALSPDGKCLAAGDGIGMLTFWDTTTGQKQATVWAQVNIIVALAFAPDGKSLACGGQGIRVYELDRLLKPAK